jgi:hypothetical protein
VRAATDLRDLLAYDGESLVRGLMLLAPDQRAALRRVLDTADFMTGAKEDSVSLVSEAVQAAERVFAEVEAKAAEVDGEALAEARRLLADAKSAEAQVLSVILTDRSQIIALAEKYGPELVAAAEEVLDHLLGQMKSLFSLTGP